jgi:anthranilate synthase/aminodeoxychorismate synthase-like glutamine amidotransferase
MIDNYDSFTYNLVQYLGELGANVSVYRNDCVNIEKLAESQALVISPGPGRPEDAGISQEAISLLSGKMPIPGVCLGHQAIAQVFGARIIQIEPCHGKVAEIEHNGEGLFLRLPKVLRATRYHSLVADKADFPHKELIVDAWLADGTVMAIRHRRHATFGVQFHPESAASEHGQQILKTFLEQVR